jgi:hypothetical protein
MQRPSTWIGVTVAIALVAMVVVVCAHFWNAIGGSEISPAGWVAMALGILATLGLGIGLMSLVFISSRRGYDEPGADQR